MVAAGELCPGKLVRQQLSTKKPATRRHTKELGPRGGPWSGQPRLHSPRIATPAALSPIHPPRLSSPTRSGSDAMPPFKDEQIIVRPLSLPIFTP